MKLTITELQNIESDIIKEFVEICKRNSIDYYLAYGSVLGAVRHQGPIPWDADADVIVPYNQMHKLIKCLRNELSDKYFLDYHDINKYYTATFPRIGLKGYSTMILHVDIFLLIGLPDNREQQVEITNRLRKLIKMHFHKIATPIYRGKMNIKEKIINAIYKTIYLPYNLKEIRKEFDTLCSLCSFDKSLYVANPSTNYLIRKIEKKSMYGKGRLMKYSGIDVIVPEKTEEYLTYLYDDYMKLPPKEERIINEFYYIKEL